MRARNSAGVAIGSGRAWLIFVVASLSISYQFFLQSVPGLMIPGLHRAFGTNSTQVGFLTSCFFYTYLALQIPAGLVVDCIGPRRALLWGMIGCSLGSLLFAIAPSYWVAVAARLLMGLSAAFFVPASMITAQGWHPIGRFAMLAGMAESIGMAGGALGEEGTGHAVLLFGWRHSMWGCFLLGLMLLVVMWLVIRDPERTKDDRPLSQRFACMGRALLHVLSLPRLWLIAAFASLTFGLLAYTVNRTRSWISRSINQAINAGMNHSANTHTARLQSNIHRHAWKPIITN